jgi:hypothetical protein
LGDKFFLVFIIVHHVDFRLYAGCVFGKVLIIPGERDLRFFLTLLMNIQVFWDMPPYKLAYGH